MVPRSNMTQVEAALRKGTDALGFGDDHPDLGTQVPKMPEGSRPKTDVHPTVEADAVPVRDVDALVV